MLKLGYSVGEISKVVNGNVFGNTLVLPEFVVIDSRQNMKGALFIALCGEQFDGHDFVEEAVKKGAVCILTNRKFENISVSQIVVANTLEALQKFGAHHRKQFKGQVIAITGSTGKTTTRTLLKSILNSSFKTLQPKKNFNNHIGVPLTLLELSNSYNKAVIELGCSNFGEIALLTRLTSPDIALVTNVGPAHLEKLKNLNGVAKAKGELFSAMSKNKTVVVNLDDPFVASMSTAAINRITFGKSKQADICQVGRVSDGSLGQTITIKTNTKNKKNNNNKTEIKGDEFSVFLSLIGEHNATDAVAAAAAAISMGASWDDIKKGLAKVSAAPGRLEVKTGLDGMLIIDDTYNANPVSTNAALNTLCEIAKPNHRIAILADMLELGEASRQAHYDLGLVAGLSELKFLITMGDGGEHIRLGAIESGMPQNKIKVATTHEEAAYMASKNSQTGDTLLIKGSRGMKMDFVVSKLLTSEVE